MRSAVIAIIVSLSTTAAIPPASASPTPDHQLHTAQQAVEDASKQATLSSMAASQSRRDAETASRAHTRAEKAADMTKQSLASAQAALSHAATSRYQAGAGSLTLATYVLADSPEELLSRTDLTQQILLARETEMAGALEASSRARDAEHDAEIQHQRARDAEHDAEIQHQQAEKALAAARAALRDAEMQASRFRHSTNHVSNPPSSGGGPPANASTGTLSPPVAGRITSPYGMRTHPLTGVYKLHSGTDYGSPCGTPVRSSDGGEVVQSGWRGAYGQSVTIAHDRGITTTYNHLSRISVSRGSPVEQGQTVGSVGTTGSSTGCHLHWEVLVDGSFTDPVGWL